VPPKRIARPWTVSKVISTGALGPGGASDFCVQVAVHAWPSDGAAAASNEPKMSPSESRQIRERRARPNRACIERCRTGLVSSKMISLSCRKTTFSQASPIALPSVARPSGLCLIRGFASPPHGGFAFVGKESPCWRAPMREPRRPACNAHRHTNPSSCAGYLSSRRSRVGFLGRVLTVTDIGAVSPVTVPSVASWDTCQSRR